MTNIALQFNDGVSTEYTNIAEYEINAAVISVTGFHGSTKITEVFPLATVKNITISEHQDNDHN